MTSRRTIAILLLAAAAMISVLVRASHPRADEEEEEKLITSSTARVSRDAAGNVVVAIEAAAQKEIGIVTETLKPVERRVEVEGYGFVLDPAALSKLNSDLMSAQAALDSSSAQYYRTRRLYAEQKNASLHDLQSAQATYLNDKARADSLQQQFRDVWGRQIAQLDSQTRGDLVGGLIDRREAIARVTVPIGEPLDSSAGRAEVLVIGHEQQPLHAQAVYEAPTINPQMQGQTFLLLIGTKDFPIRPGTALSARLPVSEKAQQGVMVPRSAIVRYAGEEWVYRELDRDRFRRLEIVPTEVTTDGYFITETLAPGTRIVVTGAQTLLSEEMKAQIHPED